MAETVKLKKRSRRLKGRKATTRNCSTSPRQIALIKRRAQAVDLRTRGFSFRQIAEQLKISTSQAGDDVMKALDEIILEPTEKFIKLMLKMLDEAQTAIYNKVKAGDQTAIHTLLRIVDRRLVMYGLNRGENVGAQISINGGPESDRRLDIQFVIPTAHGEQRRLSHDDLQRMGRSEPTSVSEPTQRIRPLDTDVVVERADRQPAEVARNRGSYTPDVDLLPRTSEPIMGRRRGWDWS